MSESKAKAVARQQKFDEKTEEAADLKRENRAEDKAVSKKAASAGIPGVNPGKPDMLRCPGDPNQHRI